MTDKKKTREELDNIAKSIVDACFHVHKEMGPGLLESIYVLCLVKELQLRRLKVQTEVFVPLFYKGYELKKDFSMDMLVEDEIILEVKAVELVHPVCQFQVISYLRLTDNKLGFLVNFHVPLIKDGIKRIVNNF